ncbi:MAG TPA: DNA translocase FtsK 4TM domain-containing protein [Flavisolibacter sp.]|nr:DNA translocase FtsK 4TM domain-containing protein [Flavisolibacter sp.]
MANKLKKSITPEVIEKPVKKAAVKAQPKNTPPKQEEKPASQKFKKDREEKLDLKKLARDERTWKIIGTISLLVAIFLFISFASYFSTWKEDQSQIFNKGILFLFDNDVKVANLLGRLGAYASHGLILKGFGLASFLFCCFFFVVGINLLTSKRVFSVWRNLRYVTVGLLIASVALSFLFSSLDFSFGGSVGDMISSWLKAFLGTVGTACLLLVVGISYLIWQFNPSFNVPVRTAPVAADTDVAASDQEQETPVISLTQQQTTLNDLYAHRDEIEEQPKSPNALSGDGAVVLNINKPVEEKGYGFSLVEKDEPEKVDEELTSDDFIGNEIAGDILHKGEEALFDEDPAVLIIEEPKPRRRHQEEPDLELEIKKVEKATEEEQSEPQKGYNDLPPYDPALDLRDYKYPSIDLLETHGSEKIVQDPAELEANKNQIINTLKNYDITISKISATVGPTVTLYEIVPAPGVRISRIKNLEDDIALSLAALGIRIIAPIPGKGTIGIEVPNVKKSIVSMKTLLASEKFIHNTHSLPIAIGKRIDNENFIVDLASMPHLLMAGATGQGKSVGLNAVLVSLLYKKHPSQLKFVLIDPKKVELSVYRHIENHFLAKLPGEEDAIITDTKKVINTLNALCIEMDNRYDLLKEAGARNIKEYNEKFTRRRLNPQKGHQYLPFIVLVVDEFADLIMTAGKEVEMPIARLAQLARAIGIHLIIATQRPSVNIITGTIKANFPARIAFKVSSKIDSRTILDAGGAEQLIGKGDMLISYNGEITRLQCAFVDTPEVEKIVDFVSDQRGYPQPFLLPEYVDEKELEGKNFDASDRDPQFEEAAKLIVANQIGSTSLIQRRMKLGYNRAGRLMDQLEAAGIVGANQGSKAREVLIKTEAELLEFFESLT